MRHTLTLIIALAATASNAQQADPDYGLDFVTIGAAGNADSDPAIHLTVSHGPVGRVDYEYRIMRSKLDLASWKEFVEVAYPIREQIRIGNIELLGTRLGASNFNAQPGEDAGIFIAAGAQDWAATGSWRAAALYANWLHNGKGSDVEDFINGAYDLRSGESIPRPEPDARFWIPNIHEWTKAVFYDPNRFGEGEPGYWTHPNGSDEVLVPGEPGVGQTPATIFRDGTALGQYPDVLSPWGLQDLSGHGYESVIQYDYFLGGDAFQYAAASGTGLEYFFEDRLGSWLSTPSTADINARFRLAAAIPAPASTPVFLAAALLTPTRRRP
ncbi:MAG: hypothetical protein AAFR76_13015 [Planctomycetota bacterium]